MAIRKDSPQKAAMREMTVELFTSFIVKFEYKLSNKSGKT